MTAKEMIDDLLKRGKVEVNEHIAIQLMMAGERLEKENICIQTGIACGFPCYDKCPIYNQKEKSDFEVMKQMVSENKSIKAATTIVGMQLKKRGGEITFGIDEQTYHDLSKSFGLGTDTHYAITYVIDKKQFDEIKGAQAANCH